LRIAAREVSWRITGVMSDPFQGTCSVEQYSVWKKDGRILSLAK
jgi:hypothetical protein